MNVHTILDPEMRTLVAAFEAFRLDGSTLERVRQEAAAHEPPPLVSVDGTATSVVSEHVTRKDGSGSKLRVLTVQPIGRQVRGGVLHLHGGGYVLGRPELALPFLQRLAVRTGCLVASPDYRLAPEHPFPAAFDDGQLALEWLRNRVVASGKVGVVGDSAGGGLAAALAIATRDVIAPTSQANLAFQILIHPMLDDRTAIQRDDQRNPVTGSYVWTRESNRFGWESLLQSRNPGAPDTPMLAAPARQGDLSRLPPSLILVGGLDLYLDEDVHYAMRLNRAGILTEVRVYAGTPHNFLAAAGSRVAQAAEREVVDYINRRFE
jgi:acetyl esterase/lipase